VRIALLSDEPAEIHVLIKDLLGGRGHEVVSFGAIATGQDCDWAPAAAEGALAIARGDCDEGIFFCWTGTGISIAANKVAGIRAALCTDPETAAGARVWNHANVLCLSNRSLTEPVARAILDAWFDTEPGDKGKEGVELLRSFP
jgi:ribose 5-phosphate isomerase B